VLTEPVNVWTRINSEARGLIVFSKATKDSRCQWRDCKAECKKGKEPTFGQQVLFAERVWFELGKRWWKRRLRLAVCVGDCNTPNQEEEVSWEIYCHRFRTHVAFRSNPDVRKDLSKDSESSPRHNLYDVIVRKEKWDKSWCRANQLGQASSSLPCHLPCRTAHQVDKCRTQTTRGLDFDCQERKSG